MLLWLTSSAELYKSQWRDRLGGNLLIFLFYYYYLLIYLFLLLFCYVAREFNLKTEKKVRQRGKLENVSTLFV
jgi:hypothetical protein